MEDLVNELFNKTFLDNWHHHYAKLAAYLGQNSSDQLSKTGDMDDDLMKWIEIQSKIKNKLPAELRSKLSVLNFDFDQKENLWEYLYHQLAGFVKKNGHANLPSDDEKYEILKDWLLRQIQGKKYLSESCFARLDLLGVNWDIAITRDQQWEQMFLKLKAFKVAFVHCQVPQNWEHDKSLANWVRLQRRLHATNQLRPERERKLQEIKFIWHIQTIYNAQWQRFYQELKKFFQANGHCSVPGKNNQLTTWIENQRTAKKNNTLLAERVRQLNEIGFIWSFRDIKINNWDERYKQLQAFKRAYGHCFIPVIYKENKTLGCWVASQRKLEANNQLEEAKKKKLSQLGFVWSTDTQRQLKQNYDAQWNINFEKLKVYQQVHGSCQVSLKVNPVLQRWTKWQRKLFYEGRLPAERLTKLNEINFPWNIQEGYWMKMYKALTVFRNQFGHTRVPYQFAPNWQLAAWVYRQKSTRSELTVQKVELLNMLVFDWGLNRKERVSWESMYVRLLQFKQKYGHTRIPFKWPHDPKLGRWVSRMRQEKEKIYPERVALLERINFVWCYQFADRVT